MAHVRRKFAVLERTRGSTIADEAIRRRFMRVRPYLDHGFLELDNTTAERATRSVAVGRKSYLFVGWPTGGRVAAIASRT